MSGAKTKEDVKKITETVAVGKIPYAKKLTVKRIIGDISENSQIMTRVKGKEKVWLCDIYCYITGKSTNTDSPYGAYNVWGGDFRSVNLFDGEVLKSAISIFPPIVDGIVQHRWNDRENKNAIMAFAFRIGVSADANKVGYKYEVLDIGPAGAKSAIDILYDASNAPALTDESQAA